MSDSLPASASTQSLSTSKERQWERVQERVFFTVSIFLFFFFFLFISFFFLFSPHFLLSSLFSLFNCELILIFELFFLILGLHAMDGTDFASEKHDSQRYQVGSLIFNLSSFSFSFFFLLCPCLLSSF